MAAMARRVPRSSTTPPPRSQVELNSPASPSPTALGYDHDVMTAESYVTTENTPCVYAVGVIEPSKVFEGTSSSNTRSS
jgi:hypothetical protein